MRKKNIIIVLLLLSWFVISITKANNQPGVKLSDIPKDSFLYKNIIAQLRSAEILGRMIILPETDFDQVEASQMIHRIDILPKEMLKRIEAAGIDVVLFTGKLTDHPTAKHLRGQIPRGYESNQKWDHVPGIGGSKTVLVKIGASERGKGHGSVNLELHELAHSVDRYLYGELKDNPTFLNIWEKEKLNLFPGQNYFLLFPEEYFAETFAMYFYGGIYKNKLKYKAPETFHFISKLK